MSRILLVENHLILRQAFKGVLLHCFPGIIIDEAGDGEEAFKIIYTNPPEIIFLDIKLPGETGLALSKIIKKSHPHVTIIILSNYDLSVFPDVLSEYGIDYFILKSEIDM